MHALIIFKASIVGSSYLPMVMVFVHDEHWKDKITNKPSRFLMLIVPFQRFPQPWQFVLHIRVNNTWFCKIVYPSIGTFEFEVANVDVTSNFILFVIFCCDGKDERFEDVDGFDVVVRNVDVVFNCNDDAGGCIFWRAFMTSARLLYLIEKSCLLWE